MQRPVPDAITLSDILSTEGLSHALVSNLPGAAVFVVDRDLRYLLAEGESLTIAGFKPEDFVGRTIFEVLSPELAASYEPMYRQALAGEPFEHEHDAHEHTYISRGVPLHSDGGEIDAVLVVSYDISERKRVEDERKKAEGALRESEARLQSIANLVPDLLWDSEPDGWTNWYNQRWLEYTGQTFEQAIGWGWTDAIHPDDQEESARRYREAVEQGVMLQQEHRIRRHDGAYRWFVVKASPLKDESGKVIKMYGAATDIHDRKQVEDALRESEQDYRSLFTTVDQGFCIIEKVDTLEGQLSDFRYLTANPAFERHTGIHDVVGKTIREVVPNVEQHIMDIYDNVVRTGQPQQFEFYISDLDRWIEADVFPAQVPGQIAVLFSNISDRKQAERVLHENEERQAFLLKLSDTLRAQPNAEAIASTALGLLADHLHLDRAYVASMYPAEDRGILGPEYRRPDLNPISGVYRLSDFPEAIRQAGEGTLWINNIADDPNLSDMDRLSIAAIDITAFIIGALRKGEKNLTWGLVVASTQPRQWTPTEIALVEETAERTWAAMERARAEAALRESEAKYRTLFDSIDEGLAITEMIYDDQGEIVDVIFRQVNRAYERHGHVYNVVGRSIFDVISGVEDYWLDLYKRVARTGESVREENYQQDVDRWFEVYFSRVDDNGRFVAIVFSDISERKRREQQQAFLLTFSDTLRTLADEKAIEETGVRMLAEFLRLDRAYIFVLYPSEDRAVVRAEQRKENLASLLGEVRMSDFPETVRQIENQTLVINDIDSDARLSDLNRTSLDAVNLQAFVCASVRRGERNVIWSLAASTTVPRTWTKAELELIETVAERMWAAVERAKAEKALREAELQRLREQSAREQERQRAESLAELDRAKTAFFSNVSHEFRTPLTLSLAPLQDALSDRTHPLDPVQQERLELVHRNSLRLLKLVNTLLGFSRIEAGRMEAVYEPTDLATYTAELASVFRSAIERAGLQLIVDCPPLPEPVFVDQEMWEKIVLNLLSNAFKFTFKGEITVSLKAESRVNPHASTSNIHNLTSGLQSTSSDFETSSSELGTLTSELETSTSELGTLTSELETSTSELETSTSELETSRSELEATPLEQATTSRLHVILEIRDTGAGIAPEHLPRLFERFYQVRGIQARTYEGSGIGLALVHELVRLHGGTIEVNSTLGEGTCFTIALPFGTDHLPSDRLLFEDAPRSGSVPDRYPVRTLASTAMGATAYVEEAERWLPTINPPHPSKRGDLGGSSEPEAASLSSARVLVVDDNADMRECLTRILSNHVQVEAVADGATALASAQERVPDLILSDVMMPGLDGFELLGALRADPRTREIPVILLSARAGEEAIVEGLASGADDYLIKPFSAQELVSRVTAHLQMAQLRGEALQQERIMNRQKDEFISVVSHELNTPLVSILGWTRVLRTNPPSPAMLSRALDTIERNATLQGKLVQDLLDLSRITAGRLRLNPQPVELKSVIETAIATVTQFAANKGINLTWQENVRESVVVMGDSDRLCQVFSNLLTNAIKFTPEGGRVEIGLSVVTDSSSSVENKGLMTDEQGLMTNNHYAEVWVTDTGIGIAADFLPHVFDRFRQAEEAHSVKGLGLGLAIARHIVELHQGAIDADSAGKGQGATFIVKLPLLQ